MSGAVGEVVAGRFRLDGMLGEGASGVVWRAMQLPLDRPVALKLLRPAYGADPRARLRFEREARVASALEHPSAVAIHELGEDAGRLYIAMELLAGRTLRAELAAARGGLAAGRALDVAWQIADLLVAAHAIGLVHRDLKPENVFVEPEGRVRVVDFGLAFIADRDSAGRMTVEGVVAGTPAYLSPEQARGGEVGPATDVYALGCVIFELLTGGVPFEGSEMEVITKQMFAPAPALRDRKHDLEVPAAVEVLVRRMLAKRAEERPTAAEAREALAEIDPELARGRGHGETHLRGRAARMVPAGAGAEGARAAGQDAEEVAIVGAAPVDLMVALAAAGIQAYAVTETQTAKGAAAIWAPGATPERVAELSGVAPVVTDMEPSDVARLAELVRAGVSEVVPKPVASEELARKLRRAIRIARRRSRNR